MRAQFATCALLLCFTATATAAPCLRATGLLEGAVAPCDGTLVADADLIKLVAFRTLSVDLEATLVTERSTFEINSERLRGKLVSCEAGLAECVHLAQEPVTIESGWPAWAVALLAIGTAAVGVAVGYSLR